MGMTTSLVALALLGGEPTPAALKSAQEIASTPVVAEPTQEITCEVEVLTVEGLGWRSEGYHLLKPAARQGSATIWTADRNLKASLEAAAASTSVKGPRVSTIPNAVATISSDKLTNYVRHLGRLDVVEQTKGMGCETKADYQPETATVREGFSTVFSGQRFDQGVMAKVKFAESHIGMMHTIDLTGNVRVNIQGNLPSAAWHFARGLLTPPGIPAAQVQVPEVFLTEIQGEWLVPNDDFLLISLGVNTVADKDGKAVVQERLAILDFSPPATADATATADANVAQAAMTPACRVDATTAVALENYANLTMPRVPDRSFPEAVDAEGKVYDLPPLPEAYAATDLNQISPGSPLATPQGTPITRPGRSVGDPQMVQASFEPIPDHEIQGWSPAAIAAPPAGLATMVESFLRAGMEAAAGVPIPAEFRPTPIGVYGAKPGVFDPAPGTVPALPNGSRTEVGHECQEPFSNRGFSEIPTITDESPTGQILFGSGAVSVGGSVAGAAKGFQWQTPECTAAGCPYSAEGCDMAKPAPVSPATASKVEMGVSVRDGQGSCVFNTEQDIVAALKNPGRAEVKFIPLGGGMSLQIEAKVVPTPAVATGTAPARR